MTSSIFDEFFQDPDAFTFDCCLNCRYLVHIDEKWKCQIRDEELLEADYRCLDWFPDIIF